MSDFVASVRAQLDPLFEDVMAALDAEDNAFPMAFFALLRTQLAGAEEEADVLSLFFELSTTAFQGFVFSPREAQSVDALLAACEQVSQTMTADDGHRH